MADELAKQLVSLGITDANAGRYAESLVENGIEKMADLEMVTEEELEEVGIDSAADRGKIKGGASAVKESAKLKEELIAANIPAPRAEQYAVAMAAEGLDCLESLSVITDAELKDLGVKMLGDRSKIRAALKTAAEKTEKSSSSAPPTPAPGASSTAKPAGGVSRSTPVMTPQASASSGGIVRNRPAASAPVMAAKDDGQVYNFDRKKVVVEAPKTNELELVVLRGEKLAKKATDIFVRVTLLDTSGKAIKATAKKTFTVLKSMDPDFAADASKHRDKTNILHFVIDQNRKKISGAEVLVEDRKNSKVLGRVDLDYQTILSASASNRPAWYDVTSKGNPAGKVELKLKYYASGTRQVDDETSHLIQAMDDVDSVPSLNIIILIVGSRGDVQPFLSFAKGLKARGHKVRIASHTKFKDFVRGQDVDFYPLRGDPETLMKFMSEHPDMVATKPEDLAAQTNTLKEIFESVYLACTTPTKRSGGSTYIPDVIISNPPVAVHTHTAEKLQIPLQIMFTMPWSTTKDYRHPFACFGPMKMIKGNRQSYAAIDKALWTGQSMLINKYRCSIGLPVMLNGFSLIDRLKVPQTYCMSPHLAAKPSDWGPHIDVVGFWFLDLVSSFDPNEKVPELVKFLEAGDKPFYIGFGSIVVDDPKKLSKTVISAIENARTPDGKPVRAIVHQGWAKLGEGLECGPNIFLLNKPVPHDWLFPLCSSACHHGGAGTMAAGLRVGLPTIVVPFFGDQPFWGSVVAAKKVGPEPIFNTDINPKNLKEAIEYCYQNDVIEAAQALGKLLMEEDGVAAGVDAFLKKVPATGGKFMVEIWENQRNPEGSKAPKGKKKDEHIDRRAASKREIEKMEKAALGLDSSWKPCKRALMSKKEGLSLLQSAAGDFVSKDGLEDETVNAPNYSDKSMICKMNFDDFPLPFGWNWCDIWKVDVNEETDSDGWMYSKQLKAHVGWSKDDEGGNFYRRRRHIRFRAPIPRSMDLPRENTTELNDHHPITILVTLKGMTDIKVRTPLVCILVHRNEEVRGEDGKVEVVSKKSQHSRSKIIENCKGTVEDFHQTFYFQLMLSDQIEVRLLTFGMTADDVTGSVLMPAASLVSSCGEDVEVDWSTGKPKCKGKLVLRPEFFETKDSF